MKKSALIFTFLFAITSFYAFAAIHYVSQSGAGLMNGSSWANSYPATSLQAAITAAVNGDEVWVASGMYFTTTTTNRSISFNMKNGVAIYGSFAGTETMLSQRSLAGGITSRLSGEIGVASIADNSYTVIYNQQLDSTAVIDGFEIRGGNDDRSPTSSGDGLGGGIYNHGFNPGGYCHPRIRNCVFTQNTASWGAGAFNNGYNGGNAQPYYTNCIFTQNHALIEAGGMDSYGVGGNASPTLYNCLFYSNTSASNVGAMYAWGGNSGGNCHPRLINCAFVNNTAQNGYGGAFIADNLDESGGASSGSCTVTLQNCIVWNNTASNGMGPQFYVRGQGAQVLASYSDINMAGQTGQHIISGPGIGNIDTNPMFRDINMGAGIDGIWMTSDDGIQLLGQSPCIDLGNNAGVAATDILGNSRISNSTVDLGPYETIITVATGTDTRVECDSLVWIDGNTYYSSNNTATFNIVGGASNMMDSLVTLNLTMLYSATGTDNRIACEPLVWIDGNTYFTNNNTATFTLVGGAANSCDSIVTLDLTMVTIDVTTQFNNPVILANASGASYRWLDCNNSFAFIAGETGQSFTATSTGNYAVEITQNTCVDTSACVAVTTIGIDESEIFRDVIIRQSQGGKMITLDLASLTNASIKVFNLNGQVLFASQNITTNIYQFEFNFAAGLYLIEIRSDGASKNYKLIVK